MTVFFRKLRFWFFCSALLYLLGLGCSTTKVEPLPSLPEVPTYVGVQHPAGRHLSDIEAFLKSKDAPSESELKTCEEPVRKLISATQSRTELKKGVYELVKEYPVHFHWCFYRRMVILQKNLRAELPIRERQGRVIDAYKFLAPVAKGFRQAYNDSRYLRWAIQQYREVSEWVFFRPVELSPEATLELVEAEDPTHVMRENLEKEDSIIDKYGLVKGGLPIIRRIPRKGDQRYPSSQPVRSGEAGETADFPKDDVYDNASRREIRIEDTPKVDKKLPGMENLQKQNPFNQDGDSGQQRESNQNPNSLIQPSDQYEQQDSYRQDDRGGYDAPDDRDNQYDQDRYQEDDRSDSYDSYQDSEPADDYQDDAGSDNGNLDVDDGQEY